MLEGKEAFAAEPRHVHAPEGRAGGGEGETVVPGGAAAAAIRFFGIRLPFPSRAPARRILESLKTLLE